MKRGLVAGFAGMLLVMALVARRAPVHAAMVPAPQAPTPVSAVPATLPAPGITSGSESSLRASEALEAIAAPVVGDPSKDLEEVRRAGSWPEFYRTLASLKLDPEDLEKLIIARLARDLELPDEARNGLHELLQREQAAVTRGIIERYGPHFVANATRLTGQAKKDYWTGLRQCREAVRRLHDPEYQQLFNADQMRVINEHLRNERMRLMTLHDGDQAKFLVVGVGQ